MPLPDPKPNAACHCLTQNLLLLPDPKPMPLPDPKPNAACHCLPKALNSKPPLHAPISCRSLSSARYCRCSRRGSCPGHCRPSWHTTWPRRLCSRPCSRWRGEGGHFVAHCVPGLVPRAMLPLTNPQVQADHEPSVCQALFQELSPSAPPPGSGRP